MYKLTPRMEQHLETNLTRYHDLFDGGRCIGWELEELIYKAIVSDTSSGHHANWKEAGHDDKADIKVRTNGQFKPIQIKSGQIKTDRLTKTDLLTLSGHRLGRFKGDFGKISSYLNDPSADIISIPYLQTNDGQGRHHEYQICYVPKSAISGIFPNQWIQKGAQYKQTNAVGTLFSISPSMSWQIWWKIPTKLVQFSKPMKIR